MLVCSVRWDHIWIQSPMTNIRIALYRLIRRLTGRAARASGVIQTGITHPQDLEDPFSDPSARERVAQVMLMKQARSLLGDRPKRNEAPRKRSFSRLEALELLAAQSRPRAPARLLRAPVPPNSLPMLGTLDEVVLPKTKDYLRGSRTVNVVPRVSLESTLISPPCASTSNFAT